MVLLPHGTMRAPLACTSAPTCSPYVIPHTFQPNKLRFLANIPAHSLTFSSFQATLSFQQRNLMVPQGLDVTLILQDFVHSVYWV